jgi:hypothetical protein
MNTQQLAAALNLKQQSIRKRLSETGTYYCLRPIKLPNGRLRWPADSIEQLSRGQ